VTDDERELEAIRELARRKQRFDGVFLGVGVGLGVAAIGLSMLWMEPISALYFRLTGSGNPVVGTWLVAALIPIGLSQLVRVAVLRAVRPAWLAEAAMNYGVKAERLQWVVK
jgi:hypothetical protein